MGESEEGKILKATGIVGAATFLSRILGLVRHICIAALFGAAASADAFFVAFRIPNMLRRLVGEGALTVAFLPVFSDSLVNKSRKDAKELVDVAFTLFSMILLTVTVVGILAAPWLVRLFAPGFLQDLEKFDLTVQLTRMMFPYIFFIGLTALGMGVLNALRHFAVPALHPVLLNLAIIGSALLLSTHLDIPVYSLAIGVLLGGVLQLGGHLVMMVKKNFFPAVCCRFRNPDVLQVLRLMVPAVFGLAVYEINYMINTILVSFLPEGSVSYLEYAYRFIEFPQGIFVIALATASLPSLAALSAMNKTDELKETVLFSLRSVLFLTIPAMVGLIVLRVPIFNLLFQRGAFDYATTLKTADALMYYAFGLWAIGGSRILAQAYYAQQDTATPVKAAALTLPINLGFGIILMRPMLHCGLALAVSIAAASQFIFLFIRLNRKLSGLPLKGLGKGVGKVCIASVPMMLVAQTVINYGDWTREGITLEKTFLLISAIGLGGGLFIVTAFLLRCEELKPVWKAIVSRMRGRKSETNP